MNWLNGGGQLNIQPRIEFAYGDGTTTILIPTSGNQFSVSENVEYTVTYIPYLLNNAKIPILNNIDFQIATNWSGDPDYYIMQVFTSKSMSFNFGGSFTFTE